MDLLDDGLGTIEVSTFTAPSGSAPFPPVTAGGGMMPLGAPRSAASATTETVAGGFGLSLVNSPQALAQAIDDISAEFGPQLYDAMDLDPVLAGSQATLDEAVLAERIEVIATVQAESEAEAAGGGADTQDDPTDAPPAAVVAPDPAAALSEEVAEACRRQLDRVQPPLHATLAQVLRAKRQGHKLAEKVYEPGVGPDAGRLVYRHLKVKPRWAYNLVVDAFSNVVNVLAFCPADPARGEDGGWRLLPRERFALATWDLGDGDPRGRSEYRRAYRPWNFKVQLDPGYYRFTQLYAGARVWGELPPNAQKLARKDGTVVSAQQDMLDNLAGFLTSNSVFVCQNGGSVHPFVVPGDGGAYVAAYDRMDRWMTLSQLGTADLTMPAEHYSRGEGEVGQDVVGNKVRFCRTWLADWVRWEVLFSFVELNWGREVAEAHTPHVSFGNVEHQDSARNANAVGKLHGVDYFAPSQLPKTDRYLGLPARRPGEPTVKFTQGVAMAQLGAALAPEPAPPQDEPPPRRKPAAPPPRR
jgi:hypothetical protein